MPGYLLTSLMRGFFLCEVFMKQLIQIMQYLVAAVAIFMLLYFSYLVVVGLGAFMLPLLFLIAVAVVLIAKFDHEQQEKK